MERSASDERKSECKELIKNDHKKERLKKKNKQIKYKRKKNDSCNVRTKLAATIVGKFITVIALGQQGRIINDGTDDLEKRKLPSLHY